MYNQTPLWRHRARTAERRRYIQAIVDLGAVPGAKADTERAPVRCDSIAKRNTLGMASNS